jgi:hypothetical protein
MHNHSNSGPAPTRTRTEIEIKHWRPYANKSKEKTLQGFFTAVLPSGMVINDLMLHEKSDGSRWIGLPSREYTNQQGTKQYMAYIEFDSKEARQRFQEQILEALDHQLTPAKL